METWTRSRKNLLLFIALAILLTVLWLVYRRIDVFPMADFVEYWASGYLNLTGGNPYDVTQMLALERSVGWDEDNALMMLNPPWILSYAMLWGMFGYEFSRYLCFIVQICLVCLCAILLWNNYSGDKKGEWVSWLILLSFGPILHALRSGQVTLMVLLGSVGFLHFIRRNSDFWAGAMASLVLYKPHLSYLFVLAVLVWAISRKRYRVLLGMFTALFAATCLAWLVNPQLIAQYIQMLNFYPLENWMTATMGATIRLLLDPYQYTLQFFPAIAGIIWLVVYWLLKRKDFDWITGLPVILLVSIVTTPYGWTLDFSVLAVCVVRIAVLINTRPGTIGKVIVVITYWIANLLLIAYSASQNWFWWFPSFLLVWYLFALKYLTRTGFKFPGSDMPVHVNN
jgi:Glycosyltransferase family 87